MKKFLKDTRGVVMMEYIILGCFAVAITLVSVLALGKVYCNGLATMGFATVGAPAAAVSANESAAGALTGDIALSQTYAGDLATGSAQGSINAFEVYATESQESGSGENVAEGI